ncbi:MAG: peptidoglycan bridge formation glycyltransferase FemA/FemB family protein [Treponema sp.]|nr:peptidoglycan bridge formation glycyltransferase FemA/FemB family protein [Treponema sp.]
MYEISVEKIQEYSPANEGSFLQTPFWGEFKAAHGWNLSRYLIKWVFTEERDDHDEGCHNPVNAQEEKPHNESEVNVLVRSFAKGAFSLAYIPLYPGLPFKCTDSKKIDSALEGDGETFLDEAPENADTQSIEFANLLQEIAFALKPYLPKNTICVRFDPDVVFEDPESRDNFNYGMNLISYADRLKVCKNNVDIQPPDSTLIDLNVSEDEILSRMKNKWRYNIGLSERKGVVIEKILGNDEKLSEKLDIFYELYKITSERDGIAIHGKKYYESLLKKSADEIALGKDVPLISLYLAKHEDDYLGAIITLNSKTESIYLYGCSSNVKRNLMPNFLLQWTAMKDAKAYGSLYYDMYGMPPTDDENHPMHGLYLFKTGFGGKNIHRCGTYDVRLNPVYKLATAGENLRAFWHKKVMKKIRGR